MGSNISEQPGIKYEITQSIPDKKTEEDTIKKLVRYISNQLPRYILDEPEEAGISDHQLKLQADIVTSIRHGKLIKASFMLYQNINGTRCIPNDRLKEVMDKKISKITEYEIKEV